MSDIKPSTTAGHCQLRDEGKAKLSVNEKCSKVLAHTTNRSTYRNAASELQGISGFTCLFPLCVCATVLFRSRISRVKSSSLQELLQECVLMLLTRCAPRPGGGKQVHRWYKPSGFASLYSRENGIVISPFFVALKIGDATRLLPRQSADDDPRCYDRRAGGSSLDSSIASRARRTVDLGQLGFDYVTYTET